MSQKFIFPNKGIHIVASKVGEADYFLDQLKACPPTNCEFNYIFSAFVSASRSITFSLQYVMKEYPGFTEWYEIRQRQLKKSELARFFVEFRNIALKTGIIPIAPANSICEGFYHADTEFYTPSNSGIKEVPRGNVLKLSEQFLTEILIVLKECYTDFDYYIDPRVMFTERGIDKLFWTVEDVEEYLGFDRGYTDTDFDDTNLTNREIRLNLLRPHGGDETLQYFLDKYLDK